MAGTPFDEADTLDGTLGSLDHLEEPVTFAGAGEDQIQIAVTGAGLSDPAAMGLAEDLTLLVRGFVRGLASAARKTTQAEATPVAGADAEIEVALDGLRLDPDAEGRLRDLIREFVQARMRAGETEK